MKHFNEKLDLEIGTSHTFLRAANEELDSFQCQNLCSLRQFKGVIRCSADSPIPPPIIAAHHAKICPGKFLRVFEITRTQNNETDTRYVVHKQFENPKPAETSTEHHLKVTTLPREIIDITETDAAAADGPKVVATTQVIDLDNVEFSAQQKKARKIVTDIKAKKQNTFEVCPFCGEQLEKFGGLRLHLDLCLGSGMSNHH